MLHVLKESLLQALLAVATAGFFSVFTDTEDKIQRWNPAKRLLGRTEWVVLLSCIPGILLCTLLQHPSPLNIPFQLGLLPLMVGTLYGRFRTGILLIAFSLLCNFMFTATVNLSPVPLRSGIILIPFILLWSHRFQQTALLRKKLIVSAFLLGDLILKALSVSHAFNPYIFLWYAIISVAAGFITVHIMNNIEAKLKLRREIDKYTSKYLTEAGKLLQFMDSMPLAIVSLDCHQRNIHMNPMMLELYKKRKPCDSNYQMQGQSLDQLLDPSVLNRLTIHLDQALEGTTGADFIQVDSKVYFVSYLPVRSSEMDEITGIVIVAQDITELEVLRNELGNVERLSLVGQMAAGITHEIRNPMAVVRGFLQLMREKSPDTMDHYYRIVMEELDRANEIINDFLSLAQNRIVEKEECHIHDLIHELVPLLWADANLRGQTIELKLGEHVPQQHLNSKEIKQLLLNLSRNAMEAMNDKGVLTITTHAEPNFIELSIHDTGPGIPKEQLDRLFEPFYTTKTKGTGLGLALCKNIAERHHGNITIHTAEGKGTTFTVRMRQTLEGQHNKSVFLHNA